MKRQTNFDLYLEEQLKDPEFTQRFKKAGEAWDVALKLASLRKASGLSQKELARRVGTSQQQISRLESPSYEGHSLSMLRRVAAVLGADIQVEIQLKKPWSPAGKRTKQTRRLRGATSGRELTTKEAGGKQPMVAERKSRYGVKSKR